MAVMRKDTISACLVREALQGFTRPELDAGAVLASQGLPSIALDDPRQRVPVELYGRIWLALAAAHDDEFFGMAERPLRRGSFNFLCRSGVTQPTVRQALIHTLNFMGLMLGGFQGRLVVRRSLAEVVLQEADGQAQRPFAYFTYWMIVHGLACWLAGRRIPLMAVELRCAAPDYIDDYQVMFSDNLRFSQASTRIIFAAEALDLPIRRSKQELRTFLALAPSNILVRYRDANSLASQIKSGLRAQPASDWPTSEALAQSLCMSPSTLRRRLAAEGIQYQAIKDNLREEQATRWLADPSLSYTDIAEQLGFADASAFYKAFRKWTGTNPGHYRQLILGDD
ncbi:MAG: AraC family transcriptional regulator [Pseudomonas sp.]